jgi:serine/threonine protein kinase
VPPEIIHGERPSDRSDVWSLGTTIWQLLAGRPPFRDTDDAVPAQVMRRIENDPLPALRRPEVPTELKGLLEQMTAKDPLRRPSADDVVRRAAELARADGHALGTPLPLPGRRPATETWAGPAPSQSVPPQASGPSVSGPPRPRNPHHDDAATGRIPVAVLSSPASSPRVPLETRQGPPSPPVHHEPPAPQPAAPRRRRWGWIATGLAVLVIASMVGGGLLTYRYGPERTVASPPTTVTVTAAPAPAASPVPGPTPAAVPPGGVAPLFLAQVEEVDAATSLTKQAFGINGRFYPQSINVGTYGGPSQPAGIDYLLNRQYRTFSTAFGIADTYSDVSSTDGTPPSCTLQVLADDRPLGPARTATRDNPVLLENLDISGGLRLRLVVTQNSASSGGSSSNGAQYPCTLGDPVVAG